MNHSSGERGVHVVSALLNHINQYEVSVNLVNQGALPGLPDWAIVEVPAVVNRNGVNPASVTGLPPAIMAVLNQQIAIQDRAVEAAVHGDRSAALQALVLDPVVSSYDAAIGMLDKFIELDIEFSLKHGMPNKW
jgi:alpha-galactosidase